MPGLLRIFIALLLLAVFGCNQQHASIDETDLRNVAAYFYHPGKPSPDPADSYKFLSAHTREQVPLEQWKHILSTQIAQYDTAVVLKTQVVGTVTYGIVSLTEHSGKGRTVSTATWILENNKWRRLKLPAFTTDTFRSLNAHDFPSAKKTIELWLDTVPFSVEAYDALILCLEGSGPQGVKKGHRSVSAIIDVMLTINPEDTRALFIAATRARNAATASKYLAKLKDTTEYQHALNMITAKKKAAEGQQSLHAAAEDTDLMQKLIVLAEMNDLKEFKKIASRKNTFERLTMHIEQLNPEEAASFSGRMGIAYYKAGDKATAFQWLEFGLTFGQANEKLHTLNNLFDTSGQ